MDTARLGAKKRRLLCDRTLTPDEKMIKLLPVSRTFARASNMLRQFNLPSKAGGPDEEDPINGDELVTPSIHKWMKRMVHALGPSKSKPTPTPATATTTATPKRKPVPPPKPRQLVKDLITFRDSGDDDEPFPPPPPPLLFSPARS